MKTSNIIGWALIAIAILQLIPILPDAFELIQTRIQQDFSQEAQSK